MVRSSAIVTVAAPNHRQTIQHKHRHVRWNLHTTFAILLQPEAFETNIILAFLKKQSFRTFVTISQPDNENHNQSITIYSLQPFSTHSMLTIEDFLSDQ